MPKNLVIVESPAKAKTIEKYLGPDFRVLSSVGHIRKDVKVDVNNNFAVTYEIDPEHKKVVNELKKAAKAAKTIWLATDEDREGESISWHLAEVLNLPRTTHRITFHEITKPALEYAVKNPRTIDMDMVYSQQARQTLDMLVGYDLSGVVRRKVPGAISAGRVQSPALRLIVEREREITDFTALSTFKISGFFNQNPPHTSIIAQKTEKVNDKTALRLPPHTFSATLDKLAPKSPEEAKQVLTNLQTTNFIISDIQKTEGTKANPTPFATATLQIEANAKLGFSSRTTMSAAQGLYQAGLITYHRTDSLNLSAQALSSIADFIKTTYGEAYLHTRHFKTKSASAQEAHEAIRPTNIHTEKAGKNSYEQKLYQLIRSRTLASQMTNAKVAKTTVKLKPLASKESSTTSDYLFIAKGEMIIFDGFLKVYGSAKDITLPPLAVDDTVFAHSITAHQTFSKPPARYTEGSLVKKLEELGIGRPSTYASIISAIQTRNYVVKGDSEGKPHPVTELVLDGFTHQIHTNTLTEKTGSTKGKLIPTPSGELITDFLTDHFKPVIDYDFTANIETKLDQIAERKLSKLKMLQDFYQPFSKLVVASAGANRYNAARELGIDPKTKQPILAKISKNGGFIQLGENEKISGKKPRFAPLPQGETTKTVTLEQAIEQLKLPELPRTLGHTPDGDLIAATGPFGPYLKAGKYNIQLKEHSPYTVDFSTAFKLYQQKKASILADWGDISIINGVYGPYIKGPGRFNNLKIPKDQDPLQITEQQARELLAKKHQTKATKAKTKSKTTKTAKKAKKKPAKATNSNTTGKATKSKTPAKTKAKKSISKS